MALTVLFMVIFAIVLVSWSYKNQYSFLFAAMSIGMATAVSTMVIEIQRAGNYYVSGNVIYSRLDAKIFKSLNKITSFSITELQIVRNIGIVIFLIMNLLFVSSFAKCIKKSKNIQYSSNIIIKISMMLYCIAYFIFYNPVAGYRIFLKQFTIGEGRAIFVLLIGIIHIVLMFGVYLYLAYPIFFLIYYYKKHKLTLFLEQMLSLIIALVALDSMFIFFFFSDMPLSTLNNLLQNGFWRSINVSVVPRYYTSVLPVISFASLLFISYFLIRFQTTNLLKYFKEYSIKKNLRGMHNNLRDVLHSEKNVIFSTKILAEEVLDSYGTKEGLNKLNRLLELSNSHLDSLTQTINNIKDFKIRTINRDFFMAINQALKSSPLPAGIVLKTNYCCNQIYCNYDLYHMSQVIINLLVNAVDGLKGVKEPCITLSLEVSEHWVHFSVEDNGQGISPKSMSKIYKPYYSTRSKQNNWGIGLSYVSRVIKAHWGYMRVLSEEGKWTRVEILLTRGKEVKSGVSN